MCVFVGIAVHASVGCWSCSCGWPNSACSEACRAICKRVVAAAATPPGSARFAQARSLHESPFSGPTAFMVGNERGGLTREQIEARRRNSTENPPATHAGLGGIVLLG